MRSICALALVYVDFWQIIFRISNLNDRSYRTLQRAGCIYLLKKENISKSTYDAVSAPVMVASTQGTVSVSVCDV